MSARTPPPRGSVMTSLPILTPAQKRALLSSVNSRPIPGLISFAGIGTGAGLRRRSWEKMMARLRVDGLVQPYPHGGYEVTEAGRAAIATITDMTGAR